MAQGWKSGLTRFAEWFSRLAYINLLWILFTIVGLVLLGFIPATVAMFTVIRTWLKGNLNPPNTVFQLFWKTYKQEFIRSNLIAFIPFVLGYILYIDIFVFEFPDTMLMQSVQFIIYVLSIYYLLAISFFYPIYVEFQLKWLQFLKMLFLMPFVAPFRGLTMIIIGYGIVYLMSMMPVLYLFFVGSIIAYLWLLVALPTFSKLHDRLVGKDE